jgi:GIY-YIG catalytic domain-containing protein/NUMOD3 motif-containing protein
MLVYQAKNQKNGKVYIGYTTKSLPVRKKQHVKDAMRERVGRKSRFYTAIERYGATAFKFRVIARPKCAEEMYKLEKFFIKLFRSYSKRWGYNTKLGGHMGGRGATGYHHTEEAKRRIGAASKGITRRKGYKLSKKHKAALLKSIVGVPKSKEHRRKLSIARKGMPSPTKGKKASLKTRILQRIAAKKRCTPEWRKNRSQFSKLQWKRDRKKMLRIVRENLSKIKGPTNPYA